MRAYVDSDPLIWLIRGDHRATRFFQRLAAGRDNLWIGATQRVEIVFHLRTAEVPNAQELLLQFQTQPVTEEIVDYAAVLYRQWHPSHGSDVNDCILAATALLTGGKIYTLNTKHYPMPDLAVARAW